MTVGCQAQQQNQQQTNLPDDELGVAEENSIAGECNEIEKEEDCRDESSEEGVDEDGQSEVAKSGRPMATGIIEEEEDFGEEESAEEEDGVEDEDGLGQSEIAQAGSPTATASNMGSFQMDDMSVIEEDNYVDILMQEDNLEDEFDSEDDFNIDNLEGNNGEGDSSLHLPIMAPFNKVFNNTDAKFEVTKKNVAEDGEMNFNENMSQEQSTKSVLELLEEGLDETGLSEMLNSSEIHQADTRSDHNDGHSFAKVHMLYVAILINGINL